MPLDEIRDRVNRVVMLRAILATHAQVGLLDAVFNQHIIIGSIGVTNTGTHRQAQLLPRAQPRRPLRRLRAAGLGR